MTNNFKTEACVESFAEAWQSQQNGADQIELCSRLDLDGLTPSQSLIERCFKELDIDIKVMIRPKGGEFEYSADEISEMKKDINFCKKVGVSGVVFGILKGKSLDIDRITELAKHAQPLKVTIHKAIDYTEDILAEVESLLEIHEYIDTILTSGGKKTAEEGAPILAEMIKMTKDKIHIMPAGKITKLNLDRIHNLLNTSGYHGRKIVGDLTQSNS